MCLGLICHQGSPEHKHSDFPQTLPRDTAGAHQVLLERVRAMRNGVQVAMTALLIHGYALTFKPSSASQQSAAHSEH